MTEIIIHKKKLFGMKVKFSFLSDSDTIQECDRYFFANGIVPLITKEAVLRQDNLNDSMSAHAIGEKVSEHSKSRLYIRIHATQ